MQPRQQCPPQLQRLAEQQAFVVSREQALGLGLSRHALDRYVRTGLWRPLGRSTFHTLPAEPTWPGLAWAGVLIGGDQARIGGVAAAHLHRIEPAPTEISVLVPWARRPRDVGPWAFVRERPDVRSSRSVGGPPRTTIEDTVLDLVGDADPAQVVAWVTAAVQQRLTTPTRLRRTLDTRKRVPQRRLLVDLLVDVDDGAESPLELAYLRDVERAHGLPTGRRQASRLGYRSDVSYDDTGVLVELDGRLGHTGMGRFRDMARDNAFVLRGRPTLRYGWIDITDRMCAVADQVATLLTAYGWEGLLSPCFRCRGANSVDI